MDFNEHQIRALKQSSQKRWLAICKVLLPLSLSFVLDSISILISLVYAGHVGVKNGLAVVGLSQTFCKMVIICFIMGVLTSADTLITQEYGAGRFDNCASYFNKMILSTAFLIALFLPLILFSGSLLSLIGVEREISQQCQDFLLPYYVAQILFLENQNLKIMLRSQQVAWPSFVGSFLSVITYIISMEYLLRVNGPAMWIFPFTFIMANLMQFLFLIAIVLGCSLHTEGTLRCLRWSDLHNWGPFVYIALITLAIEIIEGYNAEIMSLIIATISSTTLAAQNLLFCIQVNLYFFIAFGVSTTVAIFVGNFVGMKEVHLARKIAWEVGVIFFFISLLAVTVFAFIPETIINIFTSDEAIVDEALKAYFFILALIPLETVNWVAVGVLKGLGKMHWIPIMEIVLFYLFFQPLCYIMVKVLGYGYALYWAVYIAVVVIMIVCNFSYLKCLNFEKVAQEIEDRQLLQKGSLMGSNQELSKKLVEPAY